MEVLMDVIGYARVSTTEQATEGISLEVQEFKIRIYCELKDFRLLDVVIDAGVSGAKLLSDREGGRTILEATSKGWAKGVVILKLDRLFRDAADCLTTTKAWDRKGIGLHIIDMGGQAIDTSSTMGRMFLTMTAGFAELERNLISERTRTALQHKRTSGHLVGAVPYGYDLQEDHKTLVPNDWEQEIIRHIGKLRSEGKSYRGIADCLRSDGIRTKRGNSAWTARSIQLLVQRSMPA
jgi:site-specific DNA recombinase